MDARAVVLTPALRYVARVRITRLLILCLAVAACGETRLTATSVPTGVGADAILLRVPSAGGVVRAYRAGRDSVLWTSTTRAPATAALIGFDDFQSVVLGRSTDGHAYSVDLRLGSVETLGGSRLAGVVRTDGGSVFGLDPQGSILRLTAAGTWVWKPPHRADEMVPTPDGALIVIQNGAGRTRISRLIPPESRLTDSTEVPASKVVLRTSIGDRLWIVSDSGIIALRTRDLTRALTVRISDPATVIEATPSGDRLFVATRRPSLRVIDRFAEREIGRIPLPAPALALRIDPDGRYLLVRVAESDSIHVVSIGTSRVITSIAGEWRDDLPLVTPDGRILVVRGADVVHVDAETGRERLRYADGADDIWLQVRWNGFRPRAAGLDKPVEFEEYAADSAAADSALSAMMAARYGDVSSQPLPPIEEHPRAPLPSGGRQGETWNVSFATLLGEGRAREMAERIRVDGRAARVIAGSRDGIPIWRVVLGPFNSRDDAERAGIAAHLPYWVFEGAP